MCSSRSSACNLAAGIDCISIAVHLAVVLPTNFLISPMSHMLKKWFSERQTIDHLCIVCQNIVQIS